jgi:hypothetical protein
LFGRPAGRDVQPVMWSRQWALIGNITRAAEKIDGVVASIMGVGLMNGDGEQSVYERRDLIIVDLGT